MAAKDVVVDSGGTDTFAAAAKRQIEMSPSNFAKSCGVCHVGGGQLEYDRDMLPYGQAGDTNEGDRYTWRPTRIEGGAVVSGGIVEVSTNASAELYQDNRTEVDCMMCHMNQLRVGAAWYKSIGCGPANPVGPADSPDCSDPRFTYPAGQIYDSYNRNAALSLGFFKQAASAGIGALVDLSTGAIAGNPPAIPGASIAPVPNSGNCAQCHARNEADNIGLPGEAQQYGGMIAGYGNFFRITQPGLAFDLDKIDAGGACTNCTNDTKWNEFGCKTGMGKRSQKTGPGSSDRFGMGLCLGCDMMNAWTNMMSVCAMPGLQQQCDAKAGKDIVNDGTPYSLIGADSKPVAVPGKMPDADVHDVSSQGIKCGTCHYAVTATASNPIAARTVTATVGGTTYSYTYPANTDIQKIDHQIAQGFSMLEHANDQLDGTVTCGSCHTERTHPALVDNGGTLVSPTPTHASFPALHISKIDCRTCHIPQVYSSPGRLLFRDWSAGGYRQTEGSNGNANHFDFAYNFLEGSMSTMPPLRAWVATPEGSKITPILPSLLPIWTGSAIRNSDGFVLGWAPAKTRDITNGAALVAAKNPSFGIRLNGTNDHPLFEGFQLTDPMKIESKEKIDAMADELANYTGAGYAAHAKVRDPRLNLSPTFFDPSHGVVKKEWAIGSPAKGGCVMCHSSSDPSSPNYSPYSVGFFDGSKELLKNGMMQMADADCDNPLFASMFQGANGQWDCIEPSPFTGQCDTTAYGTTSTGLANGEVGACKEFFANMLMPAFGISPNPGFRMDGIEFMQMMAIQEGATGRGCNPMMQLFGQPTGCQMTDYYGRNEIRAHFQKNLQQSKFSPVVAGSSWISPITNQPGAVPSTMGRVFGIISVGKNPSNAAHANKFDLGATCYNPMNPSQTFPCDDQTPGMNYIKTSVNANQFLGYTSTDLSSLMNPGTGGVSKPLAYFVWSADAATSYKVNFDATGSTCANTPCTYTWAFGGAGTADLTNPVKPTYTYAAAGSYSVMLTLTDALGLKGSTTQQVTASVVNTAPTVSTSPVTVTGYLVSFCDASTDAQDAQSVLKIVVNWGDGSSNADAPQAGGTCFTHTYATAGAYTILHMVTDTGGLSASESRKFAVPQKFAVTAATSPALGSVTMILKYNGTAKATCTTATDTGSCTFPNVLPGCYDVQPYKSGYTFTPGKATNVCVGPDVTVTFTHTP